MSTNRYQPGLIEGDDGQPVRARVPNPDTGRPVAVEGEAIRLDGPHRDYWHRRIAAGDIVPVAPPESEAAPEPATTADAVVDLQPKRRTKES